PVSRAGSPSAIGITHSLTKMYSCMNFNRYYRFVGAIAFCFGLSSHVAVGADEAAVSFRSDIAPILLDNCLACHGAKKAEGGYRVDNYDELLKPGDSGESPVVASDAAASELLRRLRCDESERMPAESEALPEDQIAKVQRWIE